MQGYNNKMYTINELIGDENSDTYQKAVEYYINSPLPNEYFLQQFRKPYPEPFCHKKYWEAFARILVGRGLPRIFDVVCEMLVWWQDLNWPGFSTVKNYFLKYRSEVLDDVKKVCIEAAKEKDTIWLINLLTTFFNASPIIEDICNYLEDDSWKEFDKKYDFQKILSEMK